MTTDAKYVGSENEWERAFRLSEKIQLKNENERYETKTIKVLLINHEKFENNDDRDGSMVDQTDLKIKFQKFGFTVEALPEPDNPENEKKILKINWGDIKKSVNNFLEGITSFDSIIVVISSHGFLCHLESYCGDVYKVDDFLKLFDVEDLKGKPKLFFINACRDKPEKNDDYFPKLIVDDCVLLYASYPGKVGRRHEVRGTRILRSLRIALEKIKEENIKEVYVLDFLTDIIKHVGIKPQIEHQMPVVSFNLTNKFFINFENEKDDEKVV